MGQCGLLINNGDIIYQKKTSVVNKNRLNLFEFVSGVKGT